MKRALYLFLVTAALLGCDDDPGETETDTALVDVADSLAGDSSDGDVEDAQDTSSGEVDVGIDTTPPPTGPGIFSQGCPQAGRARALQMEHPDMQLEGPDALGRPGDYLLMNDRAAFVVVAPGRKRTYWYYNGILVDAVALEGCAQAGPEQFEEFVPLLGRLDTNSFGNSILRGFRGDRFELLNDGSNGEAAVLRVHGEDDLFWLIDHELIRQSFESGQGKALSEPMGVEIAMDYILEPDSNVLRIDFHITNTLSESQTLMAAAAIWYGDSTHPLRFADSTFSLGGFGLDASVPWLASEGHNANGSIAFAIEAASAATLTISGVRGFIDLNQFLISPPVLGSAGSARETYTETFFIAVGPTDANSASRHLHAVNPRPLSTLPASLEPLSGVVLEEGDGTPIAGARVLVQIQDQSQRWQTLDSMVTDASGAFDAQIQNLGGASRVHRLIATLPGRAPSTPLEITFPATGLATLTLGQPGTLTYDVSDGSGTLLPAKISLWQQGREAHRFYSKVSGPETVDVPPGDYEVTVTRGFEHAPHNEDITITAGQNTALVAALPRVVDTTGYFSTDGHMHAGPSSDSDVTIPDRVLMAAAEGLDVVISTDHEYVSDWYPGVVENGLTDYIHAVSGQEVTATNPEHINMYPVVADNTDDDRGDPVVWYGKDLGELFAAIHERGATVAQLNHPRQGCAYLCLIDYDRLTGEPGLTAPTALGFAADAELWSWDFEAIEYMNGHRPVFIDPANPKETGHFEDWMSFHNLGHPVTATGVTDVHGTKLGSPRTYFIAPTEDITAFSRDMLGDAIAAGRAVVSTGAFAHVTVNGTAQLGDTLTDTDGTVDIDIRVEALPEIDVSSVQIFVNCDRSLDVTTTSDALVKVDTTVQLSLTQDAHIVVLGMGTGLLPRGLAQFDPVGVPRFTTNPIFVDVDGNGVFDPPGGKTCDLGN